MGTFKSFEEIEAWQAARELAGDIYKLTQSETFSRDFSLKDQINKSAGSVMDNIAEGFGRGGTREFIQFLSYSSGSCAETQSQLYRALDRGHVTEDIFTEYKKRAIRVGKMIHGLITYLQTTSFKGIKFKAH